MNTYNTSPTFKINIPYINIDSFLDKEDQNIDWQTVQSFAAEWDKFSSFGEDDLKKIGDDYFDMVTPEMLNGATVLDVGCGSGRWSKYLCEKVKHIEAIDPSDAVLSAHEMLKNETNVRVSQASVNTIPFEDNTFDFLMTLGVLHHIPDTRKALDSCVKKIKAGGWCLVYLYYSLDNRGLLYKLIFHVSNLFRSIICRLPSSIKKVVCDAIALTVYWPLSRFSKIVSQIGFKMISKMIPLSYYGDKSLNILRNDSLDRFGTPLEQRFSKDEIREMMESSGLTNIIFSENAPYWHAVGQKK